MTAATGGIRDNGYFLLGCPSFRTTEEEEWSNQGVEAVEGPPPSSLGGSNGGNKSPHIAGWEDALSAAYKQTKKMMFPCVFKAEFHNHI